MKEKRLEKKIEKDIARVKRKSKGERKHIRRMKALARKEAVIVNPKKG